MLQAIAGFDGESARRVGLVRRRLSDWSIFFSAGVYRWQSADRHAARRYPDTVDDGESVGH